MTLDVKATTDAVLVPWLGALEPEWAQRYLFPPSAPRLAEPQRHPEGRVGRVPLTRFGGAAVSPSARAGRRLTALLRLPDNPPADGLSSRGVYRQLRP